uniref:Leucine-rich repeat-containing N-terminal plant-type domain-containing protein n=1 Tax=Manihot esculenta TaxID=3983 RepID=A0A2C9UUV1_MANES
MAMAKTEADFPNGGKRFEDEPFLDTNKSGMFGNFSIWHPLKLVTYCLVLLSFLSTGYPSSGPDLEGEALVELLKALNDSNNQIKDWNYYLVSPCFSWSHVTCTNGRVTSLSLASNGFSGTLSPAITKLKFLVSLELQNNSLSGPLPNYFSNLVHLENLNLAKNKFNGSIPVSWGQLFNLKHLDLSANDLIGPVPVQFFSIPEFKIFAQERGLAMVGCMMAYICWRVIQVLRYLKLVLKKIRISIRK